MGIKQGKWQAHLNAAQASGLSLVGYAAQQGINVRRLYEARHARARANAAQACKASAFARVKLKSGSLVDVEAEAQQSRAVGSLAIQARLGNGVILTWTHNASNGPVLAELMHTLAALPCSA
jgi:hypothetical protein